MPYGAQPLPEGGVRFRLYAPGASSVDLAYGERGDERHVAMEALPAGWFERTVDDARAGTRYTYAMDGADLRVPDPASRMQAADVHSASVVVDPAAFDWPDDGWTDRPWHEQVVYELHVGTFTPEGTYAGAQSQDPRARRRSAITTIELMPLADVPGGARNWGLRRRAALRALAQLRARPRISSASSPPPTAAGLAVMIDVVYNHFGPEGNFLHAYAPQFWTEEHHTPWGAAIAVEHDDREFVRDFFISDALYWLERVPLRRHPLRRGARDLRRFAAPLLARARRPRPLECRPARAPRAREREQRGAAARGGLHRAVERRRAPRGARAPHGRDRRLLRRLRDRAREAARAHARRGLRLPGRVERTRGRVPRHAERGAARSHRS